MEQDFNPSRRQFLRNTSIIAASAAVFPGTAIGAVSGSESEKDCHPTTLDYYGQGPFYLPNAPVITNSQLAQQSETGTRLIVSGLVRTIDCSAVIANAEIDIWQADSAGAYDTGGFNLRGKTFSNSQGFYLFETVLPGKYLNGSQYRPRHIHFHITPPGYPKLTTQLYFQGDPEIPADAAASITSGQYNATARIIPITLNQQGKYEGTWDIVVNGDGAVGTPDLHLERGMIYRVSPNPFSGELNIHYGVFSEAKVAIQVFDLQGALVATLDETRLSPQKYTAVWKAGPEIPSGVYFIALRVNDLQVHYLKVSKI